MSASDRMSVRAAARTALLATPEFADATLISAWAQSVDAGALPALAVATPTERVTPESHNRHQRELVLAVVLKRMGDDDIEDALDVDADAIETVILAAVFGPEMDCALTQTETRVDGDGARRVGTLTMTFTVTYWTDEVQ